MIRALRHGGSPMEQSNLVHPSAFCWNPHCDDYGKVHLGNMRTFVETIGTVFYGRHHAQDTIIECLALLAERNSLAAIHRVKGVNTNAVGLARQRGRSCGTD
jgi:hypothetical protein